MRVNAPAEAALAAVREVTLAEMPLVRVLFRLRRLPAHRDRPLFGEMVALGFRPLDDATLVAVGRPWSPRTGLRAVEDFGGFDEPGWAKLAAGFGVREGVLSTETRVWLTDARSRRRFRVYWLVVRPFSGLVRRSWLAAARRRAEAS